MPLLNGWKEISRYAGRGVRTIQRWERLYAFPIHRPEGSSPSPVLALTDEVDQWSRAPRARHVDQVAVLKAEIESLRAELKAIKDERFATHSGSLTMAASTKFSRPTHGDLLRSAPSGQD